ncbi:hypothetical protein FHEFKHOI_00279 [Candidatus Methanoperedenaceae archaeon GB50]|nr:hypothetical protein AIOGIFDO_00274 [Candidatus Methanoperedenaceae archaeon GB37]CAD7768470.1 hypothetical protein FHEFKHOI_00279 [Candidatus Methanoperedenaceae archaeon GB50]CAD7773763.1 MAG: hypothetical protein KBONHNOK_00650 [Candidatus Methanoperedenaceae archaeon GB50]
MEVKKLILKEIEKIPEQYLTERYWILYAF